ncbi:uncharacterized protein Z520_12109 [Fonsecaea multimorphosa CBS 102226]|uniref:Uncharacterized protein n=1 Tax=Fonsecaea multimorphosa CBS 102226 TaxID=1442371 RepID=A0A0D2K7A7_9EURO|nr:uncharacterized protein Z520_12109 [Fonsecaea multimorphosa CBS 102226]KIX92228.1 hypothetical protein Z520_12109 [Fonsecaea multimorphosa CBS 102226]OAL17603.1 hypothetical protein AYO22_11521 [Fonsecaea multimorphosa]
MAKTKTKGHSKQQKDILRSTTSPLVKGGVVPKKSHQKSIEELLTEAAELLEQSQPELALPLAEEALKRLEDERQQEQHAPNKEDQIDIDDLLSLAAQGVPTLPSALTLNAEIQVALGDVDSARRNFTRATRIDKDGALISAEPWLWLAQLCEEGGVESIRYFEQACEVLRNEIEVLEEAVNEMDTGGSGADAGTKKVLDEKKSKLADALCAMAEVYMTDLSWESDAESRCETLVTEAVAVCPEHLSAGVLQTLASVRISQERIEDARTALKRSLDIWWKDNAPPPASDDLKEKKRSAEEEGNVGDDGRKPDFATRVSLSRLLMEVQLEQLAMSVLEGLVREDDQSVECWYLGGWCQVLIAQKPDTSNPDVKAKCNETAKQWLENCLRLYRVLGYEDERLREHAVELVAGLKKELGEMDEDDEGDAWEDVDDQEDDDEDEDDGDLEIEADGEDEASSHPGAKAGDGDVEMT